LITLSFNINLNKEDHDFVYKKQKNYSYAFRQLWKHYDLIDDSEFIAWIRQKLQRNGIEIPLTIGRYKFQAF